MKKIIFTAALCMILCGACTVKQDIVLQAGGAGTARLEAALHPVFMAYYKELAAGFVPGFDKARPRYFNEEAIREGFRRNAELELLSCTTTETGKLSLDFRIKNITGAIKNENPAAQNIISLSTAGGRETLAIRLNKDNLASLLFIIPDMNTPFAKMLLPPAKMSADEYREHLAWALEDYAKNESIDKVLMDAVIHLTVRTPAKIITQKGGLVKNEREVVFAIPVLQLFTLERPLEFSLTY